MVSHLSRGLWASLQQHLLLCLQHPECLGGEEAARPLPFHWQYLCKCWGLYGYPKFVQNKELSLFPLLSTPLLGNFQWQKTVRLHRSCTV